ncbi:MAG: glycosyltransferase family 39 protein [Candidatus Peregrinibacteria bacterium]
MHPRFRLILHWLPEALLGCLLGYFTLRSLGTFPAAWADDSLFMIVAKMVALGRGYVLPIIGYDWPHPFILAVGPTIILPSALAMKLFGLTVAAARIPMVLYLFIATGCSYLYVRHLAGIFAARWSLALIVTLSAFVNTGKAVMGEIPGYAFLILGLLLLRFEKKSLWIAVAIGIAFGLALVTKITYGLLLPVLGLVWIIAFIRKDWREFRFLTVALIALVLTCLIGAYWLGVYTRGFFVEIYWYVLGGGDGPGIFNILLKHPVDLLRLPYVHFLLIAFLGFVGWMGLRKRMSITESIIIFSLVILFALYFLNGSGWYRHLLPSTLILFLFVPTGMHRLLPKSAALIALLLIILAQGWWQITYRGSNDSPEAVEAAKVIVTQYADTSLVVLPAEVFVHLPDNPHWLFLSAEMELSGRRPAEVEQRMSAARCLPTVRRVSNEERDQAASGFHILFGRYVLFDPPADCPHGA